MARAWSHWPWLEFAGLASTNSSRFVTRFLVTCSRDCQSCGPATKAGPWAWLLAFEASKLSSDSK
jgi:hypothetical protein